MVCTESRVLDKVRHERRQELAVDLGRRGLIDVEQVCSGADGALICFIHYPEDDRVGYLCPRPASNSVAQCIARSRLESISGKLGVFESAHERVDGIHDFQEKRTIVVIDCASKKAEIVDVREAMCMGLCEVLQVGYRGKRRNA